MKVLPKCKIFTYHSLGSNLINQSISQSGHVDYICYIDILTMVGINLTIVNYFCFYLLTYSVKMFIVVAQLFIVNYLSLS